MSGKPGRKWAPLRGDYVQVRELAQVLRDVASGHGLTVRRLAERMPYGHTSISENLGGEKRPSWEFVAAFLDACAGHDQRGRAVLETRVRPLWEATAPGRATLVSAAASQEAGTARPADLVAWAASLRETASALQTVGQLQQSVSRHLGIVHGLMEMLARLNLAARALTEERDALREELRAHVGAADEIRRMRDLLEETQRRLEVAESLQAETSRRLDEALRQRHEAERLKYAALMQAEAARRRLAGLEQHAVAFVEYLREEQDDRNQPSAPDNSLMGSADQAVAAEMFRRVDDALGEEAATLNRLHGELIDGSPDIAPLSTGQPSSEAAGAEAIRRSEERYRALLQGGAQVVWVAGPDGAMKEDSPEWRWITGQTLEEYLGDGWLNSVHAEDRDRIERDWRERVRTGKVFDGRFRIMTKGGSYRYFEVRAVPVDRDGRIAEWVGACTDVTSQREAEEMRGRLTEQLSAAALRTARLEQATRLLTGAITVEQVAEVITEVGRVAVGALRSMVVLTDPGSSRLRIVNGEHVGDMPDSGGRQLAVDNPSVVAKAIKTRRPVLVQDLDDLARQFDGEIDIDPSRILATSDERSWAGLPLLTVGEPLGALRFSFGYSRRINEEERVFLEALAGQCTLAFQRSQLQQNRQTAIQIPQRSLFPRKRNEREHRAAAIRETCVDLLRAATELRTDTMTSYEHHGRGMADQLAQIRQSAAQSQVHAFTVTLLAPGELAESASELATTASRLGESAARYTNLSNGIMTQTPDFAELDARIESFMRTAVEYVGGSRRERQAAGNKQACVDLLRAIVELRAGITNSHEHPGEGTADRLAKIRRSAAQSQVHAFTVMLLVPGELAVSAKQLATAASRVAESAAQRTNLDLGFMTSIPDFEELDECTAEFQRDAIRDARS